MALQCAISLNATAYAVGQTPPPMATLQVYNPGAATVVVLGVQMSFAAQGALSTQSTSASPVVAPTGPGLPVVVPSLTSINIGPFPIVVASAANANAFYGVGAGGVQVPPANPQPSQPPQWTLIVGAFVYGSDGSANIATPAGLLVSYQSLPPLGTQGGFFNFAGPANFITGLLFGSL